MTKRKIKERTKEEPYLGLPCGYCAHFKKQPSKYKGKNQGSDSFARYCPIKEKERGSDSPACRCFVPSKTFWCITRYHWMHLDACVNIKDHGPTIGKIPEECKVCRQHEKEVSQIRDWFERAYKRKLNVRKKKRRRLVQ